MELSESNKKQLALLEDIYEVSTSCSTLTYIWAGLVQDIWTSRFQRYHGDIDGFTLNLWGIKNDLAGLYQQRGYEITFIDEVDFLKISRDGVHAVFNQLELNGDTAIWRHAGKEGTVYFPKAWLNNTPLQFYNTHVYISGVEFEYAIKTHPELLNPEWRGREKDRSTIHWLDRVLDESGKDRKEILTQIWSYTPYWAKRGYKKYTMPCVAWKLEPQVE